MANNKEATVLDDLLAMKTKIDDARLKQAALEGSLAASMKRLKELGFDTTKAAEARLDKLREEIAGLDDAVAKGVRELHEEYGL